MGVELVIGAVAAAASVVTGVASMGAAKDAKKERDEANKIANAQAQVDNANARRKAAREARVRRAQIIQQSENAGLGTQGSGTVGATGVVNTNLGSNIATASGQTNSINAINKRNQAASDYDFKAGQYQAFGNIFNSALGAFSTKQQKAPEYDWG
jgi:hypothetical protein